MLPVTPDETVMSGIQRWPESFFGGKTAGRDMPRRTRAWRTCDPAPVKQFGKYKTVMSGIQTWPEPCFR